MKIILCVPGKTFSDNWVNAWTSTTALLGRSGHTWGYSMSYDPVVYYARNRVLGGNNVNGAVQKPFQGSVDYDYMVWIDSDMVWKADDVLKLLSHDRDIVSGCYVTQNNVDFPIVETLDYDKLAQQGAFSFMTRSELDAKAAPFKVSYVGFGFLAVKKGVFEAMNYPWFQPRWVQHDQFVDFAAEDVSFCWTAAELGKEIWVDPSIRVGHEKSIVLR